MKNRDYKAAERALSIIMFESGYKETELVGLAKYKTTYSVGIDRAVLLEILPVLLKYVDDASVMGIIESAKKMALARRVRGWFWWVCCSFLGSFFPLFFLFSLFSLTLPLSLWYITFFILVLLDTVVFLSRKSIGNTWSNIRSDEEKKAVTFEKMIEQCKKSRIIVSLDYLKSILITNISKKSNKD